MIRYEDGDGLAQRLAQAGALCRELFAGDIFTAGEAWLRRGIFDCWQYDRALTCVALANERVVGLAAGDVRARYGMTFASLKLIAVHPDWRGQGIASRMLETIESEAKARGADHIVASDGWPLYFFGGVPYRNTEALIFFHRRGYDGRQHDFHLAAPLADNPRLDGRGPKLPEGVTVRRARAKDRDRTLAAIDSMFAKAWWFEATLAFKASAPTVYIAEREGAVVGFAAYDATNYGLFGPTGVHESLRGRKVGAVLLRKCLRDMRALAYLYALIPTNLDRLNFYHRECGATVGRVFVRFEKRLA